MDETQQHYQEILGILPKEYTESISEKINEPNENCRITLPSNLKALTINFDSVEKQKKSCDFVVFVDGKRKALYLIELKSSVNKPSEIKEKFENTFFRLIQDFNGLLEQYIDTLKLILVYQNFKNSMHRETLRSFSIKYKKVKYSLIFIKCNSKLEI